MAHLTEDTINDRIAEYLRSSGIKIYTQVKGVGKGSNKPDFQIVEPKTIFGEGEWETSKLDGFRQMTDYSNLPGAEGSFLLIYPTILKSRKMTMDVKDFFKDVKLHGLFNIKGIPSNPFYGSIDELIEWVDHSLKGKRRPDKNAQIEIIRALVDGLTEKLPKSAGRTQLFEHVAQFLPKPSEALKMTNRVVAYLLVNQIVFYRILSSKLLLEPIDSSKIKNPSDLYELYFQNVVDNIDYESVFGMDLSSLVPKRGLQYVKDLIDVVDKMRPEAFSSDFLGSMFHNVIPIVVRKPIAAYYTNQAAASLLASLTISKSDDKVADFACGSGTLLMAAYDQKAKLLNRRILEKDHKKFVSKHLTGIDVMAFAGHLAAVQLALKQPTYLSNFVRIGVEDSLPLSPGYLIKPLQKTLPVGQAKISHFSDPSKLIAKGSISSNGIGSEFKLNKVDVILMNPPFTRKQRISKEYKNDIGVWLSSYNKWILGSYSLWAYFILLADRFLKDGGKAGFVLPVAVLRQSTYSDLRKFLSTKYKIKYVIVGEFGCAFSENTSFRECLVVLEKNKKIDDRDKAHFVIIKEQPTLTNVDTLVNSILKEKKSKLTNIKSVYQTELNTTDDWWSFIPEHRFSDGFTLNNKISPLREILNDEEAIKSGLAFHRSSDFLSPENSIISKPRKNVTIQFEIIKETKKYIKFTDKLGTEFQINKSSLCPAIRTLSQQKTYHLNSIPDWLVIDRFEGDEYFWKQKNVADLLIKRKIQMKSRLGNIIMSGYGNYDIAAPGSSVIAIFSDLPIAPTWTCWRIDIKDLEDAKIINLFLNSSFSIARLLDDSIEVRGSVRKWRKPFLLDMPVLNPKKLSNSEKNYLLKLYNELSEKELPSLLDQFKNGNKIRDKIDKAIGKIAINSGAEDSNKIRNLQLLISEKILMWKEMMKN